MKNTASTSMPGCLFSLVHIQHSVTKLHLFSKLIHGKMEYAPVTVVHATDADFLDFHEFITRQELKQMENDDGVFKITVDLEELSRGTPHSNVLKWTTMNLKKLHKQQLLKGDSNNIFTYKARSVSSAELKMFKAEATSVSSYNEPTCCTTKLQEEGLPSLINHYFEDVEKRVTHYSSTPEERKIQKAQIIKDGEDMRKAFEEGSSIRSNTSQSRDCVCRDCEEQNCLQAEPNSELEDKFEDFNMYYAAGISLKKTFNDLLHVTQNLNLSKIKNLLMVLKQHFDGVSDPYMYLGRKHSLFAIHNEDAALWSFNFLFFGAPKIWIVVKPVALMLLVHHLSKSGIALGNTSCHNILGHKVAFPTPQWLRARGIPFKIVVQNPGEGMILYPNAPHMGFNCGYNVAQAVNFATKSWILHGVNYPRCICLDISLATPLLYLLCFAAGRRNQVHMDMSALIAAFYPELLDKYLQNEYIPAPNTKNMAAFLAAAIESKDPSKHTSRDYEKKCRKTEHKNNELTCPVASCKKGFSRYRKTNLTNHVLRKHKPLVEKLNLLTKIEEAHAALKLKE